MKYTIDEYHTDHVISPSLSLFKMRTNTILPLGGSRHTQFTAFRGPSGDSAVSPLGACHVIASTQLPRRLKRMGISPSCLYRVLEYVRCL